MKKFDPRNVLYSFRRCPYAIRARFAILCADIPVIIREVSLKDKPLELLSISRKATVPCLQTKTQVFTESLDIMNWALNQNDPCRLLDFSKAGLELIKFNDGPFKTCLDRTKYTSRFNDVDLEAERKIAIEFLALLNNVLKTKFLFGEKMSFVDLAIFPFIRQYAFIDKQWFQNQEWDNLTKWLNSFLNSNLFLIVQRKYQFWHPEDPPIIFSN